MSSPAAAVAGSSLARVVRPQTRYRPYRAEQVEERSRLLAKIDAFYREAYRRLSVDSTRDGLSRLYDTGVCVGLLDPVSNVMANALLISGSRHTDARTGLAGTVDETRIREEIGKHSLDGLVAFLVYFFPYLAGWEALRYLLVADADLLVAARLIVADRGMMLFSVTSPASVQAFKGALGLAAQVAKHPEPKLMVKFWMSQSSRMEQFLGFLSEIKYQTDAINLIPKKSYLPPDLGKAWDLAVSRPPYSSSIVNMPYQATRSLRMALLDTIRGFYLKALARLPRHELRTRYHRSLLRGGYCYGPLDPVSNIIINTIWYDVMFPAAQQPVLDMIGPNSLTRLESRSFYGLASFLQTRYHNLSEHEVVQCLVASCGYLPCADPNLDNAASAGDDHLSVANLNLNDAAAARGGEAERQRENCSSRSPGIRDAVRKIEQQSPCTSTQEAYEAAATAAWHCNPEAHAVFLSSCMAILQGPALSLLQIGDRLTSENVQCIASLFSPKQKPTPERIEKLWAAVIDGKRRSEAQQRRVSRKVEAALGKYLLQDGEPIYELHIICSANESVCGPEYCSDDATALSPTPCKFRYSHVNFSATRKGSSSADRHPILFFAEFDNEEEEGEPLLCCPVDVPTPFAEHVRCMYCEARGRKIVHPASDKLHGGSGEFDAVICGKRYMNNDLLIGRSEHSVQRMCAVDEDFMYVVDFKY